MTWYTQSIQKKMFDDEGYFPHYPRHVALAFISVNYDDSDPDSGEWQWHPHHELMEAALLSFGERWGGWDDATILRVLHEATGRDRLAAIFMIGHSNLPQAEDVLVSLLTSSDPLERYASACCLGLRFDERALPVLEEYLLSEVPKDEQGMPALGADTWYYSYRPYIIRQLATWGPSSMTPLLRFAFLQAWEYEKQNGSSLRKHNIEDATMYALGRRGALGTLHGIALPKLRRRISMNYLALGHLGAIERFEDMRHEMMSNPMLQQEVSSFLTKYLALTEQESQDVVASFFWDEDTRSDTYYQDVQENNEELRSKTYYDDIKKDDEEA